MGREYRTAIVGASGLVGRKMLQVLEERHFPASSVRLFASARSAGQKTLYMGKELIIEELKETSFAEIDIALFSAGKKVSLKYAPIAAQNGCVVVDNSSAWRMHEKVPLVVPEVNPDDLNKHQGIIANPNCSTIQLVIPLKHINDRFGLKRVIVSTYQSISGAGQTGVDKLNKEIADDGKSSDKHPIAYNAVFHSFLDDSAFTEEELKMINEPRKILHLPELKIAVTCVRLPILGGHAESVNIETIKPHTVNEIKQCFDGKENLILTDGNNKEDYPTQQLVNDKDVVFIGRIRKDESCENGFYLWIAADNLRKGAATNAVQIAEELVARELLNFEEAAF